MQSRDWPGREAPGTLMGRGGKLQSPPSMTAWACSVLSVYPLETVGKDKSAELKGNDVPVAPGHIRAQHSEDGLSSQTEQQKKAWGLPGWKTGCRLQLLFQRRNRPRSKEDAH